MAIRCSLLGHDWGDTEVEREREERGSEVVVTVREFRTCGRCGDRDVLGEVTEVTAADRPAADVERPSEATDHAEAPSEGDGHPSREDAVDPEDDGAEIIDETVDRVDVPHAETDAGEGGSADADRDAAEPGDEYPDDDGVILDDDGDDDATDAGPRQWPDPGRPEGDEVEYDPPPWPDPARRDPDGRRAADPDVVDLPGPTGGGEQVDPAEVLSEAAAARARDDAGEEVPPEDVEVFCPTCGYVAETPMPSLRGGDSCPECRDWLLEREE